MYIKIPFKQKKHFKRLIIFTFSNAIVHQFVANAIPSKPRATNDGVKSNNKRTQ
jgi:hypothetical protein